jgi:tetraacyldisaccharide 4'-kinase
MAILEERKKTLPRSWEKRRDELSNSGLGSFFLTALSFGFGIALLIRHAVYWIGLKKKIRLPARVISIGNLTVGGAGKTPTAILIAQTLQLRGISLAILSGGYNRLKNSSKVTTLLDDNPPHWEECGDEPWMMHQALFGLNIPILVCKDRIKSGREAITFYHSSSLILDDGFQHWRIQRDLDIVLINATDPINTRRLLPAGNLREPFSALKRAGMILITHADLVSPSALAALREKIAAKNSQAPILEAAHVPDFFIDLKTQKKLSPSFIDARRLVSLVGIAHPQLFEDQLVSLGGLVEQKWRYPDHHPYQIEELRAIETTREARALVTTLKDATRLPQGWQETLSGEVYALAIRLKITQGQEIWDKAIVG